jgi:bla regulator protein blaR1
MTLTDLSPLANHIWQSTLFAIAAWLLTLALRKNRASVRYWIWFSASIKFLIPFSLLVTIGNKFAWHSSTAIAQPQFTNVIYEMSQPFANLASAPTPSALPHTSSALPMLLLATWLCGAAVALIFWIRSVWQIRVIKRAATHLPLSLPVPVMSSQARMEPGVFGIFRPVLILPEGITDRLTPAQFKAVLAHELCHVRRRDNLIAAIHMFVETVFWFHPFPWWIENRMVEERERACDEDVLRVVGEPQVYAEGILNVCKLYVESPTVCVSGVTGADLKKRIQSIMRNEVMRKLNLTKKVVLAVAATASLAVPIFVGVMNAPLVLAQALPIPSDSATRPHFEVASVKPAGPMQGRGLGNISTRAGIPGYCVQKDTIDADRVDIRCYSLGKLIWIWAFGIPPQRIVAPAWMGDAESDWSDGPKFDISAKLPEGSSRDQVPAMLRDLLATRFNLTTHREYRDQSVYALVAAKGGLALQSASQNSDAPQAAANSQTTEPSNMNGVQFYVTRLPNPDNPGSQIWIMNSQRMGTVRKSETGGPNFIERYEASSITLDGLADLLTVAGIGPEPVVNATGDQGRYQITLNLSRAELEAILNGPHDHADVQSAGLKAARDALKKLGLELERRKAPIEVLVIDNLEKSPTGN